MSAEFHFVLVKDGLSRIVPESRADDLFAAESDGWEIVFDSARDEAHGHAEAAVRVRAMPETMPHDRMRPARMKEARTLYRSVCLEELADVAAQGWIAGRLNHFNDQDPRRLVFFADGIDAHLIWQGEDAERQAQVQVMEREGLLAEFDVLDAARREAARDFRGAAQARVDVLNRREKAGGHPLTSLDAEAFDRLERGYGRAGECLPFSWLWNDAVEAAADVHREACDRIREQSRRYRAMTAERLGERMKALEGAEFTSAVLETRPIAHGFHYSNAHGESAFGDDEYGFYSRSVTADDVVAVHWVRWGEVVDVTGFDAVADRVAAYEAHVGRDRAPAPGM